MGPSSPARSKHSLQKEGQPGLPGAGRYSQYLALSDFLRPLREAWPCQPARVAQWPGLQNISGMAVGEVMQSPPTYGNHLEVLPASRGGWPGHSAGCRPKVRVRCLWIPDRPSELTFWKWDRPLTGLESMLRGAVVASWREGRVRGQLSPFLGDNKLHNKAQVANRLRGKSHRAWSQLHIGLSPVQSSHYRIK